MMTIAETVGENIRRERETRGLSQGDLAKALHVKPQSVYRWEKGKAWPTSRNIEALAKIFKRPASSFFQEPAAAAKDPKVREAVAVICRALGISGSKK